MTLPPEAACAPPRALATVGRAGIEREYDDTLRGREGVRYIEVNARGGLVRSARLFDIYKPSVPAADMKAGERSLAVRLELLDNDNTLTDERIEATVAEVIERLGSRLGMRLRG